MKPQERQITRCRTRAGQHARSSHKHCKPCAKHAHAPPPRYCTRLHDLHLVEFSHQPVPFPSENNELKQQGDGAGETSRTTNYELHEQGWATRAPVAQTLQTVRQTCQCTTYRYPYPFARFPSCGIFTPTRTISSETTSRNNSVTAPVKPSRTTNYELQDTGWATRAPVA